MKTHTTLYMTGLILCLFLVGSLHAQRYERRVEKRIELAPRSTVEVSSKFGAIRIQGTDGKTADIQVVIRVKGDSQEEARSIAEDVDVSIEAQPAKLSVETDVPSMDGGDRSIDISLQLTVPRTALVDVSNKFGSLTVKNIGGEVTATNAFGSIEITNSNNVQVENKFGSIVLGSITGTCRVQGRNGSMRAYDIPGGNFTNAFGTVDVSNARGAVTIRSKMGAVTAKGIPGGDITNEYGRIVIGLRKNFGGRINANTSFGGIESELPLSIQRQTTKVSANGIIGSGNGVLVISNKFGDIVINEH